MFSKFNDKNVVIFGGTGSIGISILRILLKQTDCNITIFANNEHEIWETSNEFKEHDNVSYVFGDVRDIDAIDMVLFCADFVFNCAAMKHVSICENNVIEAVYTNILGLHNIMIACHNNKVKKLLHVSTDKAIEPSSVMGATKLIGERMCKNYNDDQTRISCVRFGNVYGSRGSIVPIINNALLNGKVLPLTSSDMKRYFIDVKKASEFILHAMIMMHGNEIFVPRMNQIYIKDLFESLISESGLLRHKVVIEEIGIRVGEKLNEKLMTDEEELRKVDIKGGYKIS